VTGHLHSGVEKGSVTKLAGFDCYETGPSSGDKSKVILFVTDVFGWQLTNTRLLADEFAQAGFYVYIPDLLDGDVVSADLLNTIVPRDPDNVSTVDKAKNAALTGAALGPWILKHREDVVRPKIVEALKAITATPGVGKIGAIGFCWGARYTCLLGGKESLVHAVVANHPTFLAIPAEVEALTTPTQFNIGTKDAMVDLSGIQTIKDVLAKKSDVASEVNVFDGAVHGFTVRGDLEKETEKKQKEEAANNAIRWFQKHLA